MQKFGFNINLKNSPEEIRALGDKYLANGDFQAIEVTYYENMEGVSTAEYNQAIHDIVDRYHPQVLVHISGFNLAEENRTIRMAIWEEIQNCYRYTKELGGREVVIHSGSRSAGFHVPIRLEGGARATAEQNYQRCFDLSVSMMKKACELAENEDIILYTENLNGDQLTWEADSLNAYAKAIGSKNLKFVFDVGHCYHMGYVIDEEIRKMAPLLSHLHIRDNMGPVTEGIPDKHMELGLGTLDFKLFVETLKEVGYSGLYMMELFHCDIGNLERSRHLLKKLYEESGC